MKTLLLLRHAKSSRDDPGLPDFDRPLATRGKQDAPTIGKALKKRKPLPDLILASPAVRAKETIEAVIEAAKLDIQPQFDERIYAASSDELFALVRRLPKTSSCVLLVGHNPGFEELLGRLTGGYEPMPTAALACIRFQVDHWEDIQAKAGELAWLLTPKQLDDRSDS
ncbi:MAG: histidine phosphatase family protein [Gloeobacterales cyanobacterium]